MTVMLIFIISVIITRLSSHGRLERGGKEKGIVDEYI